MLLDPKTLRAFDQASAQLEQVLNYAGYFPPVAIVSGMARRQFGIVQIAAGMILSIVHWAYEFFIDLTEEGAEHQYAAMRNHYAQYIYHGWANVGRGAVESFHPWIGSVLAFVYDHLNYRYSYLEENPVESSVATASP